jgi:hypothetical protein
MASGARYKLNTAKETEEAKCLLGSSQKNGVRDNLQTAQSKRGAEAVIRA